MVILFYDNRTSTFHQFIINFFYLAYVLNFFISVFSYSVFCCNEIKIQNIQGCGSGPLYLLTFFTKKFLFFIFRYNIWIRVFFECRIRIRFISEVGYISIYDPSGSATLQKLILVLYNKCIKMVYICLV